jgi:hypothetical protein
MVLGVAGADAGSSIMSLISKNTKTYASQIVTMAERYIELSSMVFDLQPFVPFMSKESRM